MLANYGYKDGSGDYFITIDTDKCNACEDCAKVCPAHVFEMVEDDYEEIAAAVKEEHRNQLKYSCGPCKPVGQPRELPCVKACKPDAIIHSW